MHGPFVKHLVRRGMAHLASRADVDLPEGNGPSADLNPAQFWPVLITALLGVLASFLIGYTIGQLIGALAMIESTSSSAVAPAPVYSDIEDEPLMTDTGMARASLEVPSLQNTPITAKIRTALSHLRSVGGFWARWRGFGFYVAYALVYNGVNSLLNLWLGTAGTAVGSIIVSLLLARFHMFWTHSMIAHPQSKRWRSLPKLRDCKPLIYPAVVYALAQEAAVMVPLAVAFAVGIYSPQESVKATTDLRFETEGSLLLLSLRFLAVVTCYAVVGLGVLLPASVALTRIEAALLPEGDETIVPFNRDEITADFDIYSHRGCRALFVQAWRSFTRADWRRVVKIYAKLVLAQFVLGFTTMLLIVLEVAILG